MFQLDSKMARINAALDLLEERCGGIANAVDTWEFAGVPWISLPKEKGDAEIIAAFRIVEQFNNQFDNLKVTYSALVERKDNQPETLRAGIMKTSGLFEIGTYQHRLDSGKQIVALGMLSNVILTSASPKDKTTWPNICNKTIKYLKRCSMTSRSCQPHCCHAWLLMTALKAVAVSQFQAAVRLRRPSRSRRNQRPPLVQSRRCRKTRSHIRKRCASLARQKLRSLEMKLARPILFGASAFFPNGGLGSKPFFDCIHR